MVLCSLVLSSLAEEDGVRDEQPTTGPGELQVRDRLFCVRLGDRAGG
jgi:hypothetical protein